MKKGITYLDVSGNLTLVNKSIPVTKDQHGNDVVATEIVQLHPGMYKGKKVGMFEVDDSLVKVVEDSPAFAQHMIIWDEGDTGVLHSESPNNNANAVQDKRMSNPLGLTEVQVIKLENVKIVNPDSIALIVENIDQVCDKILGGDKSPAGAYTEAQILNKMSELWEKQGYELKNMATLRKKERDALRNDAVQELNIEAKMAEIFTAAGGKVENIANISPEGKAKLRADAVAALGLPPEK